MSRLRGTVEVRAVDAGVVEGVGIRKVAVLDVGADLCTPLQETYDYPPLRVQQQWIDELEVDE